MDTTQEKKDSETIPAVEPIEEIIPEVTETTHTTEIVEPKENVPFYRKHALSISIIAGTILILGAGSFAYITSKNGPVVATVNGEKIYQTDFNKSKALIEQSATLQGADIEDESVRSEIEKQALNTLIENTLILSAAKKAGITFTDEEVKGKYDELITQLGSEEELQKQMTNLGLTEDELQKTLRERIVADKYIESVTDISAIAVSDQEIDEFLKTVNTQQEGVPPMEELRSQVKEQILAQKQRELIINLLKKLREEAEIVTKI